MSQPPYALTTIDCPHAGLDMIRQLNRSTQRGELTAEQMDTAIATEDISISNGQPHSLGLGWIRQHKTDFMNNFGAIARAELFERHLDNPYITQVVEDDGLFEMIPLARQESFLVSVAERHPLLNGRWIITSTLRGIFIPTVLGLIFERLTTSRFTSKEVGAFVESFLVGRLVDRDRQFDTWAPFIGSLGQADSLQAALIHCASHRPDLFFSKAYDPILEQRFIDHGFAEDVIASFYDTAARHLTNVLLGSASTEILKKHGYVTGIAKTMNVPNVTTHVTDVAYYFVCELDGATVKFVCDVANSYLKPDQSVLVYYRNPAIQVKPSTDPCVVDFIVPQEDKIAV